MMKFLAVFFILFAGVFSQAQVKKEAPRARIINDGAIVYTKGDFDSEVMAYLKAGQVLPVSTKIFGGAFYRIQVGKKIGYIADSDIQPLWKGAGAKSAAAAGKKKPTAKKEEPERPRNKRPMSETQFAGLNVSSIKYAEHTMGKTRSDDRLFYGLKLLGPDLLISGIVMTEVNFVFASGAPEYYEKSTGKPATGLIFMTDFQLLTPLSEGPNTMLNFGFGPMFRYSKFNLQLNNNQAYSAENMGMGAVFSLGYALRMGSAALRGEARYHWEKQKYMGLGLALQMAY